MPDIIEQTHQSKHLFSPFPRTVESLCPNCSKKINAVLSIQGNNIIMTKTCEKCGIFSDTLSNDKDFYIKMEKLYFGDSPGIENPNTNKEKSCPFDCGLCPEHKTTTLMGVIDLTNRCNLQCPYCFATSDASGYVYQPSFEQVKKMLLTLKNVKPCHTPCIQFSGGEPTLHPQFFEILKLTRSLGFTQIQIATNGITMANGIPGVTGEEFAKKSAESGLNILYLQFDGSSDDIYLKTRGKPLMEIKKKAIENAVKNNMRIIYVPTIIKGVNNHQVGDIYKFAINNIDSTSAISWQPVSLTGRIPQEQKDKLRYTLTDLATDTEKQFPFIKKSDWFPLASAAPFSRFLEIVTNQPRPQLSCHAHCGIGTYLIVDKVSGNHIPLPRFVDLPGLLSKMQEISDRHKQQKFMQNIRTKFDILQFYRQLEQFYNQEKAPSNMSFKEFFSYLSQFTNPKNFSDNKLKKQNLQNRNWRLLIIAGMHFQDSYNYESQRSQRCCVHYAAPNGKLYPFCTYNAGPYFRTSVEKQFCQPAQK